METNYQSYSETDAQPPPSYTVRVGDLGAVDVLNDDDAAALTEQHEVITEEDEDEDDLSTIDETFEVLSITSSIEDRLTWRGRMQEVLHSSQFHFFIIGLVIFDVLFVLFELLLDLGAFNNVICLGENFLEQREFCHFHKDSREMCAPPAKLILEDIFLRSENPQVDCYCGFRKGKQICIPTTEGRGVDPALVLHGFSLLILSIFMVEIVCKIIAFRLKYFTHKLEVLDGTVVTISWILDIASIVEEEAFEAASLLIGLRLWRILRVINGSVLSSKAQSDAQLHKTRIEAKKIIHALHRAQDKLETIQKDNDQMKELLEKADKTKTS